MFHLINIFRNLPKVAQSLTLGGFKMQNYVFEDEVTLEIDYDIPIEFIGYNGKEGVKFFSQILSPDDLRMWEDEHNLVNYLDCPDWGLREVLRWLNHLGCSDLCSDVYSIHNEIPLEMQGIPDEDNKWGISQNSDE
jgi:hypothetical protein